VVVLGMKSNNTFVDVRGMKLMDYHGLGRPRYKKQQHGRDRPRYKNNTTDEDVRGMNVSNSVELKPTDDFQVAKPIHLVPRHLA
jgi:hypothetical protein